MDIILWSVELFPHVAIANSGALSSAVQIVASWHFPGARAGDPTVIASWFYKVVSRGSDSDPYACSWELTN